MPSLEADNGAWPLPLLAWGRSGLRSRGVFAEPLPRQAFSRWPALSGGGNPVTLPGRRAWLFSAALVGLGVASEVGGIGLEPTTFAMSTRRSNQLS